MRVAIVWPRPRKAKWRLGQTQPDEFPDLSDALVYLEEHGITVAIEESLGWPWNPLAKMHEFYSGIDPLRALRVAARTRRYDAILCIGDATAFVPLWLRRLFGLRTPILLVDPAVSPGYPRRKRLQNYVIPRVECVVVYGRVQIGHLAREYGESVNVSFLYHRGDTDFYRPPDSPSVLTNPYIFSIGLDESRDFDTLAAAARRCRDELGVTHRFVLHTTRAVADPGVLEVHRDPVSYPRLRQLYQDASLVVLPLRDRLHPGGINTLLEAMAIGRPIVVSGSRGILDYVSDGDTVRVVAPGDVQGMSRAIAELLANPREGERLGRNARQFVVDRCDNRVYAAALADTIRNVFDRQSRRGA